MTFLSEGVDWDREVILTGFKACWNSKQTGYANNMRAPWGKNPPCLTRVSEPVEDHHQTLVVLMRVIGAFLVDVDLFEPHRRDMALRHQSGQR